MLSAPLPYRTQALDLSSNVTTILDPLLCEGQDKAHFGCSKQATQDNKDLQVYNNSLMRCLMQQGA